MKNEEQIKRAIVLLYLKVMHVKLEPKEAEELRDLIEEFHFTTSN